MKESGTPLSRWAGARFIPLILIVSILLIYPWCPRTEASQSQFSPETIPVEKGPDSLYAGNLFFQETDLEIPVALETTPSLSRSYNSRNPARGFFGPGWTADPFDIRIVRGANGDLVIILDRGQQVSYSKTDRDDYLPRPARNLRSAGLIPRSWEYYLLLSDGGQWTFNALGYLISKRDSAGNEIVVTREADGITPRSVEGPFGKKITVKVKDGRIISAEGPGRAVCTYHYDGQDRLIAAINPLGHRTAYAYDTRHLMTRYHRAGAPLEEYGYTGGGLLSKLSVRGAGSYLLRYSTPPGVDRGSYVQEVSDESGKLIRKVEVGKAGKERIERDARGNSTALRFNDTWRLIGRKGSVGQEERWHYLPDGPLESYHDALGNKTTYKWTSTGQSLTVTDPRGGNTTYSFDINGAVERMIDRWGVATQYRRDDRGRIIETVYDGQVVERRRYSEDGFIESVDGLKGAWKYERDLAGNVSKVTDGEGGKTVVHLDLLGHPLLAVDGDGRTVRWSYNESGGPASVAGGEGSAARFTVDQTGSLKALTDGRGNQYQFTYEGERLSRLTFPDGTSEQTFYNQAGEVVEEKDHEGNSVRYERDGLGRVVRQTFGNESTSFEYNQLGQVVRVSNGRARYVIRYNRFGDTEEIVDQNERKIVYRYNGKGQRSAMIGPDGKPTTYEYDRRGNLSRIIGPEGEVYGHRYDHAGRLIGRDYPNGIVSRFSYDRRGLLSTVSYTGGPEGDLYSARLSRDNSGRIVSIRDNEVTRSYRYDLAGRLVEAKGPGDYREVFGYDQAGNRVILETGGKRVTCQYGKLNDLLNDGQFAYTYDRNGLPMRRSDGTTYRYNSLGQLISVVTAAGQTVRYEYDPFGRLVGREVNGKRTEYVYDKEDIIAEYGPELTAQTRYVHGPDIDEPLSMWRGNRLNVFVLGPNNSVLKIVDRDGTVVEEYGLSPFGTTLGSKGFPQSAFVFNSRLWDRDAGLYYFRARFYDPRNGRFLSADPIRFRGGWNLYAYADNDPVNQADPLGLLSLSGWSKGFAGSISAWGGKVGLNYQHFGENDPRNGLYFFGGPGVQVAPVGVALDAVFSANISEDPLLPWEGGFMSVDVSRGIGGGSGFWGSRTPWQPEKGWVGFEGGRSHSPKVTEMPLFGREWRLPRRITQSKWNVGAYQTYYVHLRSPWSNPNFSVSRKVISPASVILKIGDSQAFTLNVTVESPAAPGKTQDLEVTKAAKWRYVSWGEADHTSRPCDDKTICYGNSFTCKKVGSFSIIGNYFNQYVTDQADNINVAGTAATIECVESEGSLPAKGPKDKLQFSSPRYTVKEDSGPATVMVTRTGQGKGDVSVQYASAAGSASPGDDYDETSGVLQWKNGDMGPKPLYVFVKDDNLKEGDETVRLVLREPWGHAELGIPKEAALTIQDPEKAHIKVDAGTSTGSLIFAVGDTVTYHYSAKIPQPPGNVPLSGVTVTDSGCSTPGSLEGDGNGNGKLDLNETWTYDCQETLTTIGTFAHTVTAAGYGPKGDKAYDQKTFTIDVQKGMVTVPDVRGYTRTAAEYDLKQAKLRVRLPIHEVKSDAPPGEVTDQKPLPGTKVDPGAEVELWISRDEPRSIFVDPPRITIKVDEEVQFTASLVTKDRNVIELDPREITWSPGPRNVFRGREPGEFTVTATARGVSGWATVIVEAEERTTWDRPISRADDLAARAPLPPPDAYTWYALCVKDTGDVVYGEDTNPVKYDILGGPFEGPRTTTLWIDRNFPAWRCHPASGPRGEWNVLCDKQGLSVVIGKPVDPTRFWTMQGGFSSEKDARGWVDKNCPTWMCAEGGGCSTSARGCGDWAVVCSKAHGGVGLTRQPDPTTHWVFASGLFGEKDARLWVNLRCPSWRCDREGRCMPGQARERERPLELPPDLTSSRFGAAEEIDPGEAERLAGVRQDGGSSRPRGTGTTGGQAPGTRQAAEAPRPQTPAKVDCSKLRDDFKKKTDHMVNRAKQLNCYRNNSTSSAYSGCAMDVVGPFFPHWPDRIFSDEACASGYASCMTGPFSAYLGCLDGCNAGFRSGGRDLKTCSQKCFGQIEGASKSCSKK